MKPIVVRIKSWSTCTSLALALVFGAGHGVSQSLSEKLVNPPTRAVPAIGISPFSRIGFDAHVGVGGVGFNVVAPVGKGLNLRAGSDFFSYSTSFQEQGANVAAQLRLRSGHAALDWFPFRYGIRASPLVVFANNNRAQAEALIPGGHTITLNGEDYVSSAIDPLHGGGSVDFRRVSPGLSVGLGNVIGREGRHFSFPVEAGFYYAGQPGLKVTFTGTACDPNLPAAIGCESVNKDAGFQQSLAAFTARNRHNLSYASYFPIFSAGWGYSF